MNRVTYTKRMTAMLMTLMLLLCGGCAAAEPGGIQETDSAQNTDSIQETDSAQNTDAIQETDGAQKMDEGDDLLTVRFLDVGQGNAVLVENDGLFMLIDGGDREYSSYVVSSLAKYGVDKLTYVISSHYDADHLNGIVGALSVYPCDMVLAADYTTDTRVYESFCEVVKERDIELVYPAMGDTYSLGDATFTVVCPDDYEYADVNDNSVGIRLAYGENSFLILGDATVSMERKMMQSGLELDSDVYLASHHGSDGSTSQEFLEAVAPGAVVISAGVGNSYGHPAKRVMEEIKATGADLYRTDLQGVLSVVSDGVNLKWSQESSADFGSGEEVAGKTGAKADAAAVQNEDTVSAQDTQTVEWEDADYVLNRNTKKFHLPSCSSAADISVENAADFAGSREDLIDAGYEPCKRCNP